MFAKLIKLIDYLPTLGENVHIVGDEQNGTIALRSSALVGPQIVVALPSAEMDGNCDALNGPLTLIVFALEKALAASSTPPQMRGQYRGCVEQLEQIIGKMTDDMTSGECPLLCGMDMQEVTLMPEAGVFGGWNGYSATIVMR
jgi:hypothetical protein